MTLSLITHANRFTPLHGPQGGLMQVHHSFCIASSVYTSDIAPCLHPNSLEPFVSRTFSFILSLSTLSSVITPLPLILSFAHSLPKEESLSFNSNIKHSCHSFFVPIFFLYCLLLRVHYLLASIRPIIPPRRSASACQGRTSLPPLNLIEPDHIPLPPHRQRQCTKHLHPQAQSLRIFQGHRIDLMSQHQHGWPSKIRF